MTQATAASAPPLILPCASPKGRIAKRALDGTGTAGILKRRANTSRSHGLQKYWLAICLAATSGQCTVASRGAGQTALEEHPNDRHPIEAPSDGSPRTAVEPASAAAARSKATRCQYLRSAGPRSSMGRRIPAAVSLSAITSGPPASSGSRAAEAMSCGAERGTLFIADGSGGSSPPAWAGSRSSSAPPP